MICDDRERSLLERVLAAWQTAPPNARIEVWKRNDGQAPDVRVVHMEYITVSANLRIVG